MHKQINHSLLSQAFQKVKANHGCAGVDGVTIKSFGNHLNENLHVLEYEISSRTYFPLPLLRILVDKGKGTGETRALSIPTVRDRVAQSAVLILIEPILDKEFENCSFAYRKGRSVKDAVMKLKKYYEQGYKWVVDSDIDAFFDNVDHTILLKKFNTIIHDETIRWLVAQWIAAEIWDGTKLTKLEKGIPQGSPISPILANLFLDELDEAMLKAGYKFVRYADDYIVVCKNPEKAKDALRLSKEILKRLHLHLDEEEITTFDAGFKYLGVIFLRSMLVVPFDKPKKKKKVISWPKPFDINAYILKRKKGW